MTSPLAEEVDIPAEVTHVIVIPGPFVHGIAFGLWLDLLLAQSSRYALGDGGFVAIATVATKSISDLLFLQQCAWISTRVFIWDSFSDRV
jgi:hypothetical protein